MCGGLGMRAAVDPAARLRAVEKFLSATGPLTPLQRMLLPLDLTQAHRESNARGSPISCYLDHRSKTRRNALATIYNFSVNLQIIANHQLQSLISVSWLPQL